MIRLVEDMTRQELICLVRELQVRAGLIPAPDPKLIAAAALVAARELETAAREGYRAAVALAVADAQAVSRHVEVHGYADPYRARFAKAVASSKASQKARGLYAQAQKTRLDAEAKVRRLNREDAA